MKKVSLRFRQPTRQLLTGSNAIASFVLLLVALLVGGSIIQALSFARFDISEDKLASLSPASKSVAARLDDTATVTLYITKELPASLQALRRQLRDMLDEYRDASGGKLVIREVDPAADTDAQEAVQRLGIPEVQFNTRTNEMISVQRGFLGLSLAYREQSDLVLPVLQDLSSFEYDFTSLLKRAAEGEQAPRTIAFLTGHGELGIKDLEALRRALAQSATVQDFAFSETEKEIPQGTSLLVLVGPSEEIPAEHLTAIDTYLMNGGKLLVFYDAIQVSQQLEASRVTTGLDTLLASYGITVDASVAGDSVSSDYLPFSDGYNQFVVQYPYLVRITKDGIAAGNPMTNHLDATTLLWPTPVSLGTLAPNVTGEVILSTTEEGGFIAGGDPIDLRPSVAGGTMQMSKRGKQPLAVALTGAIPSAYTKEGDAAKTSNGGRIVVIGDADITRPETLQRFPTNGALLLNAVDWLVQDEDLIQIRSKAAQARYLDPVEPSARVVWTWGNLLIPPLVILALGILAWRIRRRA